MSKIKIEATVAAPVQTVWAAWTQPEHITKWNFAVEDWQCPRASNDLRVGGKYSARMEAKDGSFGFDFEATYDEVIEQSAGDPSRPLKPEETQASRSQLSVPWPGFLRKLG